jgi:hypothetical protein
LLIAIAVWSGWWLWLSHEAAQQLDAGAARLNARGWQVHWTARQIGGYPFRLDVNFDGLTVAEPSGWGLSTPQLKTEAYAFNPTHWTAFVPAGLTLMRPTDGALEIGAKVLRASLSGWGQTPPAISVEGTNLTFTPAPGAKPFFVSAAQDLQFYTRAGPSDQGAVFLSLTQASAPLTGLMGRIAEGKPIDLKGDAIYSHASALAGAGWPDAVRHWTAAGGSAQMRQLTVHAGEALIDVRAGALTVDDNGRLAGSMTAALASAPQVLAAAGAPAKSPPPTMQVTLDFKNGQTMLGQTPLLPAPKVF